MTVANANTDVFSDCESEAWEAAEPILCDDDVSLSLHNQQSDEEEEHHAAQVNSFECC